MTRNEFVERYYEVVKCALASAEKARREGLLALECDLNHDKISARDIFEYGLSFVVDGTSAEIIDMILSNIINQEKDEYTRTLKNIQKMAVIGIQAGYNPRILYYILNSYTDLSLKDDEIQKILNDPDDGTEPDLS